MDLDALQAKWAEQDRKLDASLRLNRQLLKITYLNRAQSALQRLALGLGLEAAIQLVVVVALGSFLYDHIAEIRFALPAIGLDVFAIVILISLIRQMTLALQLDYGKPVAAIQRQLEALRMLRIRYIQGIFLTATLAWTPMLIVMLKGFLGLDIYRILNKMDHGIAWLVGNLLLGLAIIPLALWLSRRYSDRIKRSRLLRKFMRDLAGYNLNAAADFLSTLSAFEQDAEA